MLVNNIPDKYIDNIEYSYTRLPSMAAKVVNQMMKDKKILFYGDGIHTKQVVECVNSDVHISAIISDISTKPSYIRESFDIQIVSISQIELLEYDYLVLVGYWSCYAMEKFALEHSINIDKIFRPYLDPRLVRLSRIKNRIRYERTTSKPMLCLVLPSDRRDFITIASDVLKDKFELVKIYLNDASIYETNEYFDFTYCVHNDNRLLTDFLQSIEPEIVVFFHSGQMEIARTEYLMSYCSEKSKCIFSTTDFFFNDVFCLQDDELADIFNIPFLDFKALKECEANVVKKATGIITNWGGRYMENILMPQAQSALFSKYFHKDCVFKDIDFVTNGIKVCYTGNLGFSHIGDFHKISTLDVIFREFLENNYDVFVYNFQTQNMLKSPYSELAEFEGFRWEKFVPTALMPEELSEYHFGINILNIGRRQIEILDTLFYSLFQAKMSTYLSAGLPIIVSKEYSLLYEFVSDYKIGFGIKAGEISKELSKVTADSFYEYKNNVREYQEKFLKNSVGAKEILDYLIGIL